MENLSNNIKFNYLYRDGGNYKKFYSIIFDNNQSVSVDALETLIKSKLIDGEWFYAAVFYQPGATLC